MRRKKGSVIGGVAGSVRWTCATATFETDNQQGPTVPHKEHSTLKWSKWENNLKKNRYKYMYIWATLLTNTTLLIKHTFI